MLWERWCKQLKQESLQFRTQWMQSKPADLPIDAFDEWWERATRTIRESMMESDERSSHEQEWMTFLMQWQLALTILHEWVFLYENSREKVVFADRFGLYYRSQSMIEPDAIIHPSRWVNRLAALRAPHQPADWTELQPAIEELMRTVCLLWKSPIPEQTWVSAWLFWSLKPFKPLRTSLEQAISKSACSWLIDLIAHRDALVQQHFSKLSPLIRVRLTALVIFLIQNDTDIQSERIAGWLKWISGFLSLIPAADGEHIWTCWERWIEQHQTVDSIEHSKYVELMLENLPQTKTRLVQFAKKHELARLRIEVELMTEGDPMLWQAGEWTAWKHEYAAESLPLLHHRLEQIMKLKASERESYLDWIWDELQSVYTELHQDARWREFVRLFDLRYGRTRAGRTLREKDGSA